MIGHNGKSRPFIFSIGLELVHLIITNPGASRGPILVRLIGTCPLFWVLLFEHMFILDCQMLGIDSFRERTNFHLVIQNLRIFHSLEFHFSVLNGILHKLFLISFPFNWYSLFRRTAYLGPCRMDSWNIFRV